MTGAARGVVLLAGHLAARGDGPRLRGLAERLAARGVSAEVICVAGGGGWPDGPRLFECPGLASPWRRPWAVRRLGPSRESPPPDLLHVVHGEMAPAGLALAESWRVPYLLTVDEFLPPGGRLRLGRRWCRGLVVPGAELAEDLIRHLGVPAGWVTVIAPGWSLPPEGPGRDERGAWLPVVGASGPPEVGSGLPIFLAAARRVLDAGTDAEFVVAAEGPGEVDLRRQAERLAIADRVTFADPPAPDGPFWRVVDVFCLPATVPNAGRALAEALTHARPAIASDVPGLRPLIDDGTTGLLVRPGDPDALARAILRLLADPEAACALGRRGRRAIAERFDPDREADALAALYMHVLEAGSWVGPGGRCEGAPVAGCGSS